MRLNQITLPVLNVEKSIAFYQTLGCNPIVIALPDYARFHCTDGDATFSLHSVNVLPRGEGVWIYFEVEKLDTRVAELQLMGIVFEELPIDKPWMWREARLKDLDNNQLILYTAGVNRVNPPWRINSFN